MTLTRTAEIVADAKDATGHGSLPERLCASCAASLSVTGVGLAFMNDAGPVSSIAATDGTARRMEDLQLVLGEGPSIEASRSRRPVLQPNLSATASARWPNFGPSAIRSGVAAIFAFPLQVGAIRLGVLDLYRDAPGMLDANELSEALSFADAATELILHLQGQVQGDTLHPELGGGFAYSPVIHQSTGIISVQAGVGIGEALLLLRARAYSSGRSLLELATDVVDHKLRWDVEGEPRE